MVTPAVNFGVNLVQHALAGDRAYVDAALTRPRREYLRQADDLADTVSTERAIHGLTRRELAAAAGVSVEDVRRIEAAETVRSIGAVRRVLRVLEVEPSALPDVVLR